MKLSILQGATSQSILVFIQDSSSTTGAGLSGLAYNTSGLVAYYSFAGANAGSVQITLATLSAVNSAWSSGGFKEVDATNMQGVYRLDLPNAVLAASKGRSVVVYLSGATNMAPCVLEIELTGWDNQDGVRGGMIALPNTPCTTNDSLITSGSGTDQLTVSGGVASADVKKINAVSTSSVTTVNANLGTTQPVNFTGTSSSALVKSDMVDIAGSAVSTSAAQLGVNVVNIAGQAAALDSNNLLKVDAEDWKGSAVSALVSGMVPAVTSIRSGTAQAGGASTITLDAGASATSNLYDNELVYIVSGTGAGQVNTISSYAGSTKIATMIDAWATNPDNTSVFILLPAGPISATVSGGVNVTEWNGSAVATPNVAGVPIVDVGYYGGTAGTFSGGRPEVNTVKFAGQSITCAAGVTVGAFVGNATAALAVDASGRVDIGKILGTASAGAAGYVGMDWGHINAPTTVVNLSSTNIGTATTVSGDVQGKVLGGGASAITGTGVRAVDGSGNAIAVASTALSTAQWTNSLAANLGTLAGHDPGGTLALHSDIVSLAAQVSAILTTQMTESYSAVGVAPTLAQAIFEILARLTNFAIAGTTITVKKLDGTTTAMTLTLDSATAPTSSTRAT